MGGTLAPLRPHSGSHIHAYAAGRRGDRACQSAWRRTTVSAWRVCGSDKGQLLGVKRDLTMMTPHEETTGENRRGARERSEKERPNIDQDAIECLVRHCRMYLYGATGSPEIPVNEVASDFYAFALLHLTATMFITTDKQRGPEGVFHRLLDPAGLSTWVDLNRPPAAVDLTGSKRVPAGAARLQARRVAWHPAWCLRAAPATPPRKSGGCRTCPPA